MTVMRGAKHTNTQTQGNYKSFRVFVNYHIAQISGIEKLWQIIHYKVLVRKIGTLTVA